MSRYGEKELKPRNGHTLVVGVPARISGCANQKEVSLEDQIDNAKEFVATLYDGDPDFRIIATKGKGERLDRPELNEIEALIRSGELDLLVMEDIGRLIRGAEAVRLWGIAVDHGTRCIAPHDSCDTIDPNWEEAVLQACASHVAHNAHTSKRIKFKNMNRFKKYGAAVALVIAGYLKPVDAKTYADWKIDNSATEIIQHGLKLLEETLNCSAVADYFNSVDFPPGPYTRNKKWDGRMVRRFYANPLLAGRPGRGFRTSIKHHETGRRISVKNTESEPVLLDFPHLAHITYDEYVEINRMLAESNQSFSRRQPKGCDPLAGKAKKRTLFPGQHARCWYCGRQYVWGANGLADGLMCNGPREWLCWNSIGFKGGLAAAVAIEVVNSALAELDGLDEQFASLVALSLVDDDGAQRRRQLEGRRDELNAQRQNLIDAMAKVGLRDDVKAKLAELDRETAVVLRQLNALSAVERSPQLPRSAAELRIPLLEEFARLSQDSWEFGDLMRKIMPEFHVYAVRLLGEGPLLPRALVRLDLSGNVTASASSPELKRLTERWVTLNLFQRPDQERLRANVVHMTESGLSPTQVVHALGGGAITKLVAKALKLHERMVELGVDDPYLFVAGPPADMPKLKRHRNPRYRFTPVDGHEPPLLNFA